MMVLLTLAFIILDTVPFWVSAPVLTSRRASEAHVAPFLLLIHLTSRIGLDGTAHCFLPHFGWDVSSIGEASITILKSIRITTLTIAGVFNFASSSFALSSILLSDGHLFVSVFWLWKRSSETDTVVTKVRSSHVTVGLGLDGITSLCWVVFIVDSVHDESWDLFYIGVALIVDIGVTVTALAITSISHLALVGVGIVPAEVSVVLVTNKTHVTPLFKLVVLTLRVLLHSTTGFRAIKRRWDVVHVVEADVTEWSDFLVTTLVWVVVVDLALASWAFPIEGIIPSFAFS